jgi:hypothetical protein
MHPHEHGAVVVGGQPRKNPRVDLVRRPLSLEDLVAAALEAVDVDVVVRVEPLLGAEAPVEDVGPDERRSRPPEARAAARRASPSQSASR